MVERAVVAYHERPERLRDPSAGLVEFLRAVADRIQHGERRSEHGRVVALDDPLPRSLSAPPARSAPSISHSFRIFPVTAAAAGRRWRGSGFRRSTMARRLPRRGGHSLGCCRARRLRRFPRGHAPAVAPPTFPVQRSPSLALVSAPATGPSPVTPVPSL